MRERIGPYLVEGLLGQGGLGKVFRVRAPDGKAYALKLLQAGAGDPQRRLRRIGREVEALLQIRHPGVVAAYDAGAEGDSIYVVLELVVGGSLEDLLRREGRLAPRRAAEICAELARTLADLHAGGVLHRDLKPDNVLLSEGRTRLADLGLVQFVDSQERLTRTGATVGTPGYCPPELLSRQSDQDVGPSVDIYGLGATLYALLTGHPPFRGASAYEVAVKTLEEAPDRPSDSRAGVRDELLERLDAICLRCLAKDPGQRYGSMAILASELEEVARGGVDAPRRALRREASWPWPSSALAFSSSPSSRGERSRQPSEALDPTPVRSRPRRRVPRPPQIPRARVLRSHPLRAPRRQRALPPR